MKSSAFIVSSITYKLTKSAGRSSDFRASTLNPSLDQLLCYSYSMFPNSASGVQDAKLRKAGAAA